MEQIKKVYGNSKYLHKEFVVIKKIPKEKEIIKIDEYDSFPEHYEDIEEVIIKVDQILDMVPDNDVQGDYNFYRIFTLDESGFGHRFHELFVATKRRNKK